MTTILGLDASTTHVGWALWDTVTAMCRSDEMTLTGDLSHRLALACALVRELILRHQPTRIAIEQPFVGRFPGAAMKLGKMHGAIWAVCDRDGYELLDISPAEAKLAATGRGNAAKDQVQAMIRAQVGRDVGEHEADAIGVALAAAGKLKMQALEAKRGAS
jgi:crossover junction endodeoxyribonuclease RuvC